MQVCCYENLENILCVLSWNFLVHTNMHYFISWHDATKRVLPNYASHAATVSDSLWSSVLLQCQWNVWVLWHSEPAWNYKNDDMGVLLECYVIATTCSSANIMDFGALLCRVEAFLALLDYVSRANEIEIRPSSVRPSVCGIDYLWN